jgi:hypothetical protein
MMFDVNAAATLGQNHGSLWPRQALKRRTVAALPLRRPVALHALDG